MPVIHASCVRFKNKGLLICGQSGQGKSDLCLRLMEQGAELIADDQTKLECIDNELIASCPENLQGLLEVRGIGIITTPFLPATKIHLKLSLQSKEKIDRMPESVNENIEGVQIPVLALNAFECSAILKIKTYMEILNGQRKVIE